MAGSKDSGGLEAAERAARLPVVRVFAANFPQKRDIAGVCANAAIARRARCPGGLSIRLLAVAAELLHCRRGCAGGRGGVGWLRCF